MYRWLFATVLLWSVSNSSADEIQLATLNKTNALIQADGYLRGLIMVAKKDALVSLRDVADKKYNRETDQWFNYYLGLSRSTYVFGKYESLATTLVATYNKTVGSKTKNGVMPEASAIEDWCYQLTLYRLKTEGSLQNLLLNYCIGDAINAILVVNHGYDPAQRNSAVADSLAAGQTKAENEIRNAEQ